MLLVHAHSNGCDIGDMRQTLQSISDSLRVHVMSFEFPGYGLHVGTANMRTIDETLNTVLDYITDELKVNVSQVVWYGRSIGSGPTVRTAFKITKELGKPPGGVVLQCGFANFPEVAGHLFGRVAKRLVSPLWPNEAMVKELRCPVLLIHGRNDTMIPIEQSEKLWKAVTNKELSIFHTCDCGHNDFNFRKCTLRPIYDFLLAVISAPNYPATNFHIEIAQSHRTFVHHIGPLRSRLPVYSFRRPELEEWMRRLPKTSQNSIGIVVEEVNQLSPCRPGRLHAAPAVAVDGRSVGQQVTVKGLQSGAHHNGKRGTLVEWDEKDGRWRVALEDGERVSLRPSNFDPVVEEESPPAGPLGPERPKAEELKQMPTSPQQLPAQSPSPKTGKAKKVELPPIPDYSAMPPIEDAGDALLHPEGLVRTCANRILLFLDLLQRQLDRVEGLEGKSLDEVVDMVEAEYWASDPLLCLWEEVSLDGTSTRFRLGPFSIDNAGQRQFHAALPSLASSSSSGDKAGPQFLRVPVWIFPLTTAHFRCLAEWSLLHSERLERQLPDASGRSNGSGCCCVPRPGVKKPRKGNRTEGQAQTRGSLATSLAAYFVRTVERTDEISQVFRRFVDLYNNPEEAFRRSNTTDDVVPSENPEPSFDFRPPSHYSGAGADNEEVASRPSASVLRRPAARPVAGGEKDSHPKAAGRSPIEFSELSRELLREGLGTPGPALSSVLLRIQTPLSSDAELQERQAGNPLPNLLDFTATAAVLRAATLDMSIAERYGAWATAGFTLHYERLLWGAAPPLGEPTLTKEEEWADPCRPELRVAGHLLSRAMKAFLALEGRERRDAMQQRARQRIRPSAPGPAAGDVALAAPPGTPEQDVPTRVTAVHPPSDRVQGL